MYEHMIEAYEILFEGFPEPVFYRTYYPKCCKTDVHWNMFHYAQGLKDDKDPERRDFERFESLYEKDLRNALNMVMLDTPKQKRGVVAIPSSERGKVNRVTELIRRVLASNPGPFVDLTHALYRNKTKRSAHQSGNRSFDENISTLSFSPQEALAGLDAVLVVDDIATLGNSFRAVGEVLRRAGFNGTIINFAFAHTMPSVCVDAYLCDSRTERASTAPYDALIFDLDQTLIDDAIRQIDFEEGLWKSDNSFGSIRTAGPYGAYPGIKELMEEEIPFAIVSNRSGSQLKGIFANRPLARRVFVDYLYEYGYEYSELGSKRHEVYHGWDHASREEIKPKGLPNNVFSFPEEQYGGYPLNHYKPSPKGILEAREWLNREFSDGTGLLRILGIGNTQSDMIAYRLAGLTSALALWGIPGYLKRYARENWGADLVFETVSDFTKWCKANCRSQFPDGVHQKPVKRKKKPASAVPEQEEANAEEPTVQQADDSSHGQEDSSERPERTILLGEMPAGEPIEWIIIEDGENGVELLSKHALTNRPFCENASSAVWEDSELRAWLNGEFLDSAFSEADRASLVADEITGDLVSCLSPREAEELRSVRKSSLVCLDLSDGEATKWWLRPEEGGTLSAPCIERDGSKGWSFALVSLGVRPAIRYLLY